ncbi:MAG: cobalamin-binding protein [Saprospiraceae bacterium]|nr:cobalamin-binding protein [Saprospiraceae bacterium]
MNDILDKLTLCIERGKVDTNATFPSDMIGDPGADELTRQAITQNIPAEEILNKALFKAMKRVGIRFRDNEIFVPEVLMAAKAMSTAMKHLIPFFDQGLISKKGTFIIGTAAGDMHDIGKSLVAMIVEGGGWNTIDLGINVSTQKFLAAIEENPGCSVGISALLTTTMVNMENTVKEIKENYPGINVLVGGAPVTQSFCDDIGADFYSPEPHGALDFLNEQT